SRGGPRRGTPSCSPAGPPAASTSGPSTPTDPTRALSPRAMAATRRPPGRPTAATSCSPRAVAAGPSSTPCWPTALSSSHSPETGVRRPALRGRRARNEASTEPHQRKERGMTRRPWQTTFTVLALFVASVVLTGCPKKPAPQAGTGPGGGAGPTVSGGAGTGAGGAGAGGNGGRRGRRPGSGGRL